LAATAFLEATAKKGPFSLYGSLKGSLEGAAHYWPGGHEAGRAGIEELYLTFDSPALDLWLGRKVQRWGTSDGYNPLDLFNPLDLRDPVASGRLLNRVPQWLAGASLSLGAFSLEAVYLPRPGVARMPEPGSPWEPGAYRELRRARDAGRLRHSRDAAPGRRFRDGEIGARLSAALGGWDLSLMAYRGYLDEPLFRLGLTPLGLLAHGEYARYSAYGLAWAKGLGQGTFRGELALKPGYPAQGPLGWGRARLFQAVAGWDRDFGGSFYLNLQGFAETQSGTPLSRKEDRQGVTYEAKFSWALDEWAAGARGQAYLTGEGAVSEIFLEWGYNDHFRFTAGILAFSGNREGVLGQYGDNDCLYLTGRYSF
jgi:hypothetical protein